MDDRGPLLEQLTGQWLAAHAASATLISSGMGEGVDYRAGFTEVCRMAYFYSALKAAS